jgi:hypothetical protein
VLERVALVLVQTVKDGLAHHRPQTVVVIVVVFVIIIIIFFSIVTGVTLIVFAVVFVASRDLATFKQ